MRFQMMTYLNRFSFINPAKFPFFYGYVILGVATLGIWGSIPGQTIGVSVFTDPVKDALGLTRNQFSNAYMIGTILSSLFIGRAGVWFDRYGARYVAFAATLVLAFTLYLSSWSVQLSATFQIWLEQETWVVPFAVLTLLFFLMRFAGQGVLTMASRNIIMIWFDKNRGKANMFSSVALSFGFSSAPLWLYFLVERYSWQGAWQFLGLGLVILSVVIFQFYKNAPELYGLLPDGITHGATKEDKNYFKAISKQYSLKEAKTTRAFWVYALMLSFNSFFITGFTFHVISIFGSEGFPETDAISVFLPFSVVAVTISSIFNYLSDYMSLKLYLYLMLFGGVMASLGLLFLSVPVGMYMVIGGFGIMGGFFAVLNAIVWPRFYGRTHLGAITGRVMSFLILSSALAPSLFSYCFSTFGTYHFIGYLGLVFLLFLAISGGKANNPQ
ncbi:MFS transporter [Arenibacter sp. GZD96]|uniref:MFS transporter n=1 Tax=Aurantibrevibacter litoralis TaxID=3106030 RepID=UPI002AFE558E|nr:MFS transporter [Arenibacter sp. GZD-96]MEA1785131.1 MFS transporter [Arenibacter sp. GZD-96]